MAAATTTDVRTIEKLFKAGLHLGHKKNRLHPKARRYVYRMESGVSIIDLTQTATQLEEAKKTLAQAAKDGKKVLVVASKKVASAFAQELSQANGISFITTKWLPGLLTNFETIIKNVKKMKDLRAQAADEAFEKIPKHERIRLKKKLVRLEKFYEGIVDLEKKPDLLFVVDIRREKNAIEEARQTATPVVAVVDTNCDPATVTYPVVANDDSPTSVHYLITEILSSYISAKEKSKAKEEKKSKSVDQKTAIVNP